MEVSDPIIAALAVALTFLLRAVAGRLRGRGKPVLHYYSPAIATIIAIAAGSTIASVTAVTAVTAVFSIKSYLLLLAQRR